MRSAGKVTAFAGNFARASFTGMLHLQRIINESSMEDQGIRDTDIETLVIVDVCIEMINASLMFLQSSMKHQGIRD